MDATLVVEQRPGALTVPLLAVSRRNDRDVVFVLDEGIARETPVQLGWREEGWVEVLRGITTDDRVVVEGVGMIADGSPVDPVVAGS